MSETNVARYAAGLAYVYEEGSPESGLVMLEEMLLNRFTKEK